VLPGREGRYADLPDALPAALAGALRSRGVAQLYAHQREAWDAAQRGEHLVVATPTASGKSLCYTLPVVAAAMTRQAKALYLFPTKALAQDQVCELIELNRAGDLGLRTATFDGDTPGDQRQAIRLNGDIVVSNPDMLHQGILPHHTKWAQFFENLQYVVIDEIHSYRGVFGSHLANVLRRLRRVCAFYGAKPQFILCSATIGNPKDHAEALLEADVTAITDSGAPTGDKHVLLWNPPVVNPDLGLRASARSQSNKIARTAIRAGLKTLVFAQSRTMVEVLTKYLKDVFDHDPRKPPRIRAYRGGYLPTERRDAERAMREGRIDGIVSTSALELGVDIGSLDVVVLNGYPGSVAATWQRFGRAGRRQQASVGVLVASSDPLDQYVVRHPEFFSNATPEQARIAPDQPVILLDHIRCAAFELPFLEGEHFGPVDPSVYLELLAQDGVVHPEGGRWEWIADSYPANAGEPALGGRRQFRRRGSHRRAPGDHRRGRLFLRAAHALRGRDPHGAVHALPGRTPGLGRPQGLRHAHARGLLHGCDRLHQAQGAGSLRRLHRRPGHLPPRRGARGAPRRRATRRSATTRTRTSATGPSPCRTRKCTPPRCGGSCRRKHWMRSSPRGRTRWMASSARRMRCTWWPRSR
jgi:DEAD/DEAH box helicase domain-containing protein